MKKRTSVFLLAFIFALSGICFAALNLEGFSYKAEITGNSSSAYNSVRLSPEIINNIQKNAADLLLISDGVAVPYFLSTYEKSLKTEVSTYEMSLADTYLKDNLQYFDFQLLDEPEFDILATSINFESSNQFVKESTLYGSHDGIHWDRLGSFTLYQIEGNKKLSIPLPSGEKYTWYRLGAPGNQEPISFSKAWLEYNREIVSRNFFAKEFDPSYTVRQEENETIISIEGLKNFSLLSIELETDDIFMRRVSAASISKTLYNLEFNRDHYRDLLIPMNNFRPLSETFELRIANGDNLPINIDDIKVSYASYDLVFPKQDGDLSLYFGNSDIKTPPKYDIESYKDLILDDGFERLSLGEITRLSHDAPAEEKPGDYSIFLNVIIILAAAVLVFLLLTRLKKVQ